MVSCIISTYKRETEILKRAIVSIQAQTYQDIEIIVVNDAPEETALEERIHNMILELHDDRIQYTVHDHNRGACAARNTGSNMAKGEFLAFLDDDDEWLPEKLEEQLKYMADEEVGFVTCECYVIHKNGEKKHSRLTHPKQYGTDLELMLTGNYLGYTSFYLIRTSKFFEAGQFDIEMRASQDTDLCIRLLKISKVAVCQKPLLNYYLTSESISTNISARIRGYERILEKYKEDYKKYPKVYQVRLLWILYASMELGAWGQALRFFGKALLSGAGIKQTSKYCIKGYRKRKTKSKAGQLR